MAKKGKWPRTLPNGKQTPEYQIWSQIKQRCRNPKCPKWKDYGKRGIGMCDEWYDSFDAFMDGIPPRPGPGYSLGRIDNEKGYIPGNVRWETATQQNRNKRGNSLVRWNGKDWTYASLAEEIKMDRKLLQQRIVRDKLSIDEAVNKPVSHATIYGVIDGVRYSLWDACRKFGTNYDTAWYRYTNGWPFDKAVLTPSSRAQE